MKEAGVVMWKEDATSINRRVFLSLYTRENSVQTAVYSGRGANFPPENGCRPVADERRLNRIMMWTGRPTDLENRQNTPKT